MELLSFIGAGWMLKSIAVAARLGIADVLHQAGKPKTAAEIAQATQTQPDVVLRLLRLLSGAGIFTRVGDDAFTNSPISEQLRSDHPRSMRYFCMLSGEQYYDAWGGLLHTVKTGEPAFDHVFGCSIYEYMAKHDDTAAVYDRAMEDFSRPVAEALATSYDFTSARRVVDIGGGVGTMLKGILSAHPHLEGVCADLDHVCTRARASLRERSPALVDRITYKPSNFFEEVPADGDIYLLKNVLHNWNLENGVRILNTVRQAMLRKAETSTDERAPRLLVIEPLAEPQETSMRKLMNALFQMTICESGSRERTALEMEQMVRSAQLNPLSITNLGTTHNVIECGLQPRTTST